MKKRTLFIPLCLFLCIGFTTPGVLAEENVLQTQIEVTYGQTAARSMLEMINDFRTGSDAWYWDSSDTEKIWCTDLAPLEYDEGLEQVAMQRAAELAAFYSHTRPNNTSCFTAYDEFGVNWWSCGENIAAGWNSYDTPVQVFTAWQETDEPYSGQGHRRNMLNSSYNCVGIGYARIGNYHFWTQEFAYISEGAISPGAPVNAPAEVFLEISKDQINSFSNVEFDPDRLDLAYGTTASMPVMSGLMSLSRTWPASRKVSLSFTPEWSSSDPLCAEMSEEGIIGKALGETSANGSILGRTYSLPVTVYYEGLLEPDLRLPENLEILDDEALCGVSADAVSIPAGLKDIGSRVFAGSSIQQITFAGDSFTLDENTFADTTPGLTVFCPYGDTADALEGISGITVVRVRPSGGTQ